MTLLASLLRRTLSACALPCTAAVLTAAPAIDLTRLTPVPADQPVPIEDFLRPALWNSPKMNPSGTHVATLMHVEGDRFHLLVYELETQKTHVVGDDGSKDIYAFTWLNDHRIAFFVGSRKLYALGMMGVDVDNIREVYPILQYCGATLVSVPPDDRLRPLVWMRRDWLENDRDGGVAVVNTNVKTGRLIDLTAASHASNRHLDVREANRKRIISTFPEPNAGIVYSYMADRDGRLAYAFTSRDGILGMHRFEADRRAWAPCLIDPETTDILGPGDNPNEVLARQYELNKPSGIRILNATTGDSIGDLIADKDYDIVGYVYRESATRQIAGVTYHRDGPRTVWFDEGFRNVQKAIDGLFPGQVAQILDNSEKGARFLVHTYSDKQPSAYHWVDLEKRTGSLLRNTKPWIDPARMRPMQIMKFKTRDGQTLDAYVTLPKGASKKNPVPLIVLPHGGPWVRDSWGFDGVAQFLASRGYAVMQPNYRGSPGHDWKFPLEDQWEFRKMHEDVTEATRALLATGAIDPSRVGIMGGSFGAYLALSGVAHEPTLYRCAVTIAGVFDWATVLQEDWRDRFDNPSYGRMLRKLGDPKKQADRYAAISPLRHVANVRVPIFVAHGKEDQVASVTESKRLVAELEKHGVPHEKLFIGGEGHGMAYLKNDVVLYGRIEAFLAKHLAPSGSAVVAPPGDS